MRVAAWASAAVSLTPTITIAAAWIGGPTVSIVPYVAADMSSVDDQHETTCTSDIGWGVDLHVGARIDLQDPVTGRPIGCDGCVHEFAPRTLFSTGTRPLFECATCQRVAWPKGAMCTAWRGV